MTAPSRVYRPPVEMLAFTPTEECSDDPILDEHIAQHIRAVANKFEKDVRKWMKAKDTVKLLESTNAWRALAT